MKRLLFLLVLIATPVLAQQPAKVTVQLPQRDEITIESLQMKIASLVLRSDNDASYIAKLVARINELEKQVADLKAPPKAPALPAESKPK